MDLFQFFVLLCQLVYQIFVEDDQVVSLLQLALDFFISVAPLLGQLLSLRGPCLRLSGALFDKAQLLIDFLKGALRTIGTSPHPFVVVDKFVRLQGQLIRVAPLLLDLSLEQRNRGAQVLVEGAQLFVLFQDLSLVGGHPRDELLAGDLKRGRLVLNIDLSDLFEARRRPVEHLRIDWNG